MVDQEALCNFKEEDLDMFDSVNAISHYGHSEEEVKYSCPGTLLIVKQTF